MLNSQRHKSHHYIIGMFLVITERNRMVIFPKVQQKRKHLSKKQSTNKFQLHCATEMCKTVWFLLSHKLGLRLKRRLLSEMYTCTRVVHQAFCSSLQIIDCKIKYCFYIPYISTVIPIQLYQQKFWNKMIKASSVELG